MRKFSPMRNDVVWDIRTNRNVTVQGVCFAEEAQCFVYFTNADPRNSDFPDSVRLVSELEAAHD